MSTGEIASLATAAGVILVAVQLVLGRLQTRVAFEDQLAREYREIAACIPVVAFFDEPDPEHPLPEIYDHLDEYVRYLDLTNQQVFLRMQGRISGRTWQLWSDGIRDNLERDGFRRAWIYVRTHSTRSYDELGSLYAHWVADPSRPPDPSRTCDPGWWTVPWWLSPAKALSRKPDRPLPWFPAGSGESGTG